jgi:hypothetical protein
MFSVLLEDSLDTLRKQLTPRLAMGEDPDFYQGSLEGLKMLEVCNSIEEVVKINKALRAKVQTEEDSERKRYLSGALTQTAWVLKRLGSYSALMAMHNMHKGVA